MTAVSNHDTVTQRIEGLGDELFGLSQRIFEHAELGFEEHLSVTEVERLLAEQGIAITRNVGGLSTAFSATVGSGGGPKLVIFAEYDALPGIGHGCGHNVICAAAVGAFLGLAAVDGDFAGSVTLMGSPAEENGSAKELLATAGVLADFDAAMMVHPSVGPDIAGATTSGLRSVEVEYHGVAAHASAAPHLGRNALDAVVFAYQGVAALRQHIPQHCRIHGVILEGGQVANVVPELARARFVLRGDTVEEIVSLTARVQRILEGAALMSETRLEAQWDRVPPNLPVRSNGPLARSYHSYVRDRGREVRGSGYMPGSTDMGNVSQRIPSIHPTVSIAPDGVGMHTREFTTYAGAPETRDAIVDSAIGLARAGLEYLTDPGFRAAVEQDFAESGGAVDVPGLLKVV